MAHAVANQENFMTAKTKLTQGLIAGAVAVVFASGGLAIAQGDASATSTASEIQQSNNASSPMPATGTPMTNSGTYMNNSATPSTDTTMQSAPVERDAQADRN